MDGSLTKFDDLLGKYEYILVTLFFFIIIKYFGVYVVKL